MLPRLAQLSDGQTVLVRLQTSADRDLIAGLFAGLSPRSRFLRFQTGTPPELSSGMLNFLTGVDGEHHVGVLAVHRARAVGAARYVCHFDAPAVADVAVTVTDAFQRRGLGRTLIDELRAQAAAAGIRRLTHDALPSNAAAHALAQQVTCSHGHGRTLARTTHRL
jgi:GNAT superfamily N-acetyltransferase